MPINEQITIDQTQALEALRALDDAALNSASSVSDVGSAIDSAFDDPKPIDNFTDSIQDLNKEQTKAAKSATELAKETEKTSDSSKKAATNTLAVGRAFQATGVAGRRFLTLLRALVANPLVATLTLIVGGLTLLFKAFTSTKEGAETLDRVTAALSASLDVLRDLLLRIGEAAVSAFNDPIGAVKQLAVTIKDSVIGTLQGLVAATVAAGKAIGSALTFDTEGVERAREEFRLAAEQIKDATGFNALAEVVKETTEEITKESAAAAALTQELQKVDDQQRSLSVSRAKLNTELVKARDVSKDTTKSLQERISALNEVIKREDEQLNKEISAQSRRVRALKALDDLSRTTKAVQDEIAAEEIKLANLRTQSEQRVIAIKRERLALEKQAQQEAAAALELQTEINNKLIQDEQTRLLRQAEQQKAARDKNIEDTIKDEDIKNDLLVKSEQILVNDKLRINAEFLAKKRQQEAAANDKLLQDQLAALEAQLTLESFELQRTQELERQKFAEVARTEEEITAFKEDQENKRFAAELRAQQRRLQLIRDNGKNITAEQKKQLDAELALISAQLDGINSVITKKKTEEIEIRKVSAKEAIGLADQTAQAVLGFASEQLQGVIDSLQKEVDARNENIDSLQKDLDAQLRLAELGKNARVDEVLSQIETEKAARDKAARDKEQAAKDQFALDTALQASNLITAISGLYSSLSSLPFGIGVALATVLSGVLVASFVSSKVSAANAAGFYEGTEHVEKALGSNAKSFSGKDAYLGVTKSGKQFRFDGGERILNAADNKALGDMTNKELKRYALIGQGIVVGDPLYSMGERHTDTQKKLDITIKERAEAKSLLAKENEQLSIENMRLLNDNNRLLKIIASKPDVIPMPNNETHVRENGKTFIYKQNQ